MTEPSPALSDKKRTWASDDIIGGMMRLTNSYSGPPRGTGVLPYPLMRLLERTGGIVSTREVLALGIDQTHLELLRHYGSLQAVRQGWHCSPSVPDVVRLAWRFGGPLACVSALAFHQALERQEPITPVLIGPVLHVCLTENAIGAPRPALLARRWNIAEPLPPVVHWSTQAYRSGDRRAVSREVALRQADRCDQRPGEPPRGHPRRPRGRG